MRLTGPDEGSREVKAIVDQEFRAKARRPAQLWADAAATIPADVLWPDGSVIPNSTVTIDGSSMLPLMQYPPNEVNVVWATVDGGPAWPVNASAHHRLDRLTDRVTAPPYDRRTIVPRWDQAEGLAVLTSTGLTITSGSIAATVGGTNGDAIMPIYGARKELRIGFRVVVTKATPGSRSTVGFVCSAPAVLPSGTDKVFGAGYKQGFGIGLIRDNVGDIVLLQDSLLTDGDVYDIGVLVDQKISLRGDIYATMSIQARKVADGTESRTTAIHGPATYPINNLHIRTNVAAGAMSNVQMANHHLASVGVAALSQIPYYPGQPTEVVAFRAPATPNGKLVIALHGTGETLLSMISSVLYRGTWQALSDAGFTVALPRYGGDLWGNDTAMNYLVDLHNQLTAVYDLDPEVFLWGNSMGGGSAARLISDRPFPIRAAVLTEPALDYEGLAATALLEPYLTAAYPSILARDAADPMRRPAVSFAGVPVMMFASPSDTTAPKVSNADAFAAKISPYAEVVTVAVTGNHGDASHYKPRPTLDWLRSHT